VTLIGRLEDGSRAVGETEIDACSKTIEQISIQPPSARTTPGVVDAILAADLVVIGPGSLFTSVLPNLVLADVARAVRETRAARVLVANLVSERGAATAELEQHVRLVEAHAGGAVVDALLVHEGSIDDGTLRRYREEGAAPLEFHADEVRDVRVFRRNLLAEGRKLRHDPRATAEGLLAAWRELSRTQGVTRLRA